MPVFALTGNLASGKSTVAKLLKQKGAAIFDVDGEIHRYYRDKKSKVYRMVALAFPRAVKGGLISRKKLREEVFSDERKLAKLTKIVHPVIIGDLKKWLKRVKRKKGVFVAEVPLLFEKRLAGFFDATILIYTGEDKLVGRIKEVFGFSEKEARERLSLYLPVREKIKKADFIIENSSNLRDLKKKVGLLSVKLAEYRPKAGKGL